MDKYLRYLLVAVNVALFVLFRCGHAFLIWCPWNWAVIVGYKLELLKQVFLDQVLEILNY